MSQTHDADPTDPKDDMIRTDDDDEIIMEITSRNATRNQLENHFTKK